MFIFGVRFEDKHAKVEFVWCGVNFNDFDGCVELVGCKWDKLSFIYLGLPVGDNIARTEGWKIVMERITKKFSK